MRAPRPPPPRPSASRSRRRTWSRRGASPSPPWVTVRPPPPPLAAPPPPPPPPPLRVEITAKTMVTAVAVVAASWVLVRLAPVALVLVLASFLVGTLNPAVEWLARRGMKRGRGIAVVFGALL